MFKYIVGLAAIAAAIAFGVSKLSDHGSSSGPTVITVQVQNPLGGGGGGGGGDGIAVP